MPRLPWSKYSCLVCLICHGLIAAVKTKYGLSSDTGRVVFYGYRNNKAAVENNTFEREFLCNSVHPWAGFALGSDYYWEIFK